MGEFPRRWPVLAAGCRQCLIRRNQKTSAAFTPACPLRTTCPPRPCPRPRAKVLLGKSPAIYQWSRENPYPETAALLEGSALHALILEGRATYERGFAILPECDGRTKEGKAIGPGSRRRPRASAS